MKAFVEIKEEIGKKIGGGYWRTINGVYHNIIFDDIIFYSITLYWSSLLDIVSKDKKTLKMICIQTGKE